MSDKGVSALLYAKYPAGATCCPHSTEGEATAPGSAAAGAQPWALCGLVQGLAVGSQLAAGWRPPALPLASSPHSADFSHAPVQPPPIPLDVPSQVLSDLPCPWIGPGVLVMICWVLGWLVGDNRCSAATPALLLGDPTCVCAGAPGCAAGSGRTCTGRLSGALWAGWGVPSLGVLVTHMWEQFSV